MNLKLHNFFDFVVEDSTGNKRNVGHAENLVTNLAYTTQCLKNTHNGTLFQDIMIGTGTAEPLVTDTQLQKHVYTGGFATTASTRKDGYSVMEASMRLLPTELNGTKITEVGLRLRQSDTSYGVMTRALVKDNSGQPIAVEKKPDETLWIYCTVYMYDVVTEDDAPSKALPWDVRLGVSDRDGPDNVVWDMDLDKRLQAFGDLYYSSRNNKINYILDQYARAYGLSRAATEGSKNDLSVSNLGNGYRASKLINITERNGDRIYGYNMSLLLAGTIHKALKDVEITAADLGKGDGVKTVFNLPHFNNKNVQIYNNGALVAPTVTAKYKAVGVSLLHQNLFERIFTIMDRGMHSSYYGRQMGQSPYIPYKDGVIALTGTTAKEITPSTVLSTVQLQGKKFYGIYIYPYKESVKSEMIELNIDNLPIFTPSFKYTDRNYWYRAKACIWPLPGFTAVIFNYQPSNEMDYNYRKEKYVILDYDSTTGIFGKVLAAGSGNLYPDKTGKYIVRFDATVTPAQHDICSYSRTADAITLTHEVDMPFTNVAKYQTYSISRDGTFVDITRMRVNSVTWNNKDSGQTEERKGVYKFDEATKIVTGGITLGRTEHFMYRDNGITPNTWDLGVRNADGTTTWYDAVYTEAGYTGFSIEEQSDKLVTFCVWHPTNYYFKTKRFQLTPTGFVEDNMNTMQIVPSSRNWTYPTISYQELGVIGGLELVRDTYEFTRLAEFDSSTDRYESVGIRIPMYMQAKFATPPADGNLITANYKLDYLPKDSNWTANFETTMTYSRAGE